MDVFILIHLEMERNPARAVTCSKARSHAMSRNSTLRVLEGN